MHAAERLLLSCSEEEEDVAVTREEEGVVEEEDSETPQEEDDGVTRPPPPPSPTRSPSYSPPRPSVPPTPSAPLPSPPLPSTGAPPPRPWAIAVEDDEDDTPTWLRTPSPVEEAATDVQDAPRQEEEDTPQPEEAIDVEEKPNTHEESVVEDASLTTRVLCEGKTVLALHGVLTPALLAALAAQRVALPTADGGARVRVFRQAGGAVRVGNYALGAYAHGAYRATVASKRDTLPRRAAGDVARRHRAKQTAYERR